MSMLTTLLHKIVAQPSVYDTVQRVMGSDVTRAKLSPILLQTQKRTVLDVAGGTGNYASLLPPNTKYFWLDNDLQKLEGLRDKNLHQRAILGDATDIGLLDKSVDYALCIALSHHLPEPIIHKLFQEMARVSKCGLIFLDALRCVERPVSNILWRYDRGSYPRTNRELTDLIAAYFDITYLEEYQIYHSYLLCNAKPK